MLAAQDLLWGPALRKYPDLKVAWSEGGIGWIPFYLDRCDRHYTNQRWLGQDFGDKMPSDIFREHSLACYITDPSSLKVRHDIGIDIIAWECDYPHSDSIWPDAPEVVLARARRRRLLRRGDRQDHVGELVPVLRLRPVRAHRRSEHATVGALRALSPDVDTAIRSRAEWRERYESRGRELAVGNPHHDPADGAALLHRVERGRELVERHVEADDGPDRAATRRGRGPGRADARRRRGTRKFDPTACFTASGSST